MEKYNTKDDKTKEIIKRAIDGHGDKYDYSVTEYINSKTKIKIRCKKHDFIFEKSCYEFTIVKRGCPKCTIENKEALKNKNREKYRDNFIKKAKAIHGDKYDYSKMKYKNKKTKVKIFCNIDQDHGFFLITPENHTGTNKSGCQKCAISRHKKLITLTREQFIEKCIKTHGDKYDYSKTVYKAMREPVNVFCKIHKTEFTQTAYDHCRKTGCPKCNGGVMLTKDVILEKIKDAHGDKYDYSLFKDYKGVNHNIDIICYKHGVFSQRLSRHINEKKSGCPKCVGQNKTTDEVIKEFKSVHGDRYNYSEVKYKCANDKVIIICKIHGKFEQTPCHHYLKKNNCPKCNGMNKTPEEIIKIFRKKHGDKYNYDSINDYDVVRSHTFINIKCLFHGFFKQIVYSHLSGRGCPSCAKTGYSIGQIEWLTFIGFLEKKNIQHMKNGGEYKVKGLRVDGYCKESNEVFEYHGNFFHGCPKIYKSDTINSVTGETMGELYKKTLKKEKMIKDAGYKLRVIWESDWKKIKTKIVLVKRFFMSCHKIKYKSNIIHKTSQITKTDFKKPLIKVHNVKKINKCQLCNKEFTTGSSLNKHIKNKVCTKSKPSPVFYKCEKCDKICRDKYEYTRHTNRKIPCTKSSYTQKSPKKSPKNKTLMFVKSDKLHKLEKSLM